MLSKTPKGGKGGMNWGVSGENAGGGGGIIVKGMKGGAAAEKG